MSPLQRLWALRACGESREWVGGRLQEGATVEEVWREVATVHPRWAYWLVARVHGEAVLADWLAREVVPLALRAAAWMLADAGLTDHASALEEAAGRCEAEGVAVAATAAHAAHAAAHAAHAYADAASVAYIAADAAYAAADAADAYAARAARAAYIADARQEIARRFLTRWPSPPWEVAP